MRLSFIISSAAILLLVGCSVESRVKDAVWQAQLKKLKSPSTAKLVEAKVYPVRSEQERKGLFLRQSYALSYCFLLRKTLDSMSLSSGSIGGIRDHIEKPQFRDFLNAVEKACPSGAKWIEEMESLDWKSPAGSGKQFFDIKLQKDKDAVLKVLDGLIQQLVKKELETYDKVKDTVECFTVFIDYDAQNSYGAMIRESATRFNVLKQGEDFRMIEKDQDDFLDSLMGTEESKK